MADSSMNMIGNLLNDIKGLVVESANTGTMTSAQIAANQMQVDAALDSIDRIARTTNYGGKKILDGSLGFQTAGMGGGISNLQINTANFGTANAVGVNVNVQAAADYARLISNGTGVAVDTVFDVVGNNGSATVSVGAGSTNDDIAAAINRSTDSTGVLAYVEGKESYGSVTLSSAGAGNDIVITALQAGLDAGNYEFRITRGDINDARVVQEAAGGQPGVVEISLVSAYESRFNNFAGLFDIAIDTTGRDNPEGAATSVTMTQGAANNVTYNSAAKAASTNVVNGKSLIANAFDANSANINSQLNGWTIAVDDRIATAADHSVTDTTTKTIYVNSGSFGDSTVLNEAIKNALANTVDGTVENFDADAEVDLKIVGRPETFGNGDRFTFANGAAEGELAITYAAGATANDILKMLNSAPNVSASLATGVNGSATIANQPNGLTRVNNGGQNVESRFSSGATAQEVIDLVNSKLGDKFLAAGLSSDVGTSGRVSFQDASATHGDINMGNALRFTGMDNGPIVRLTTLGSNGDTVKNQKLGVNIIHPSEADKQAGIHTPILEIRLATDAQGNSITTASDIAKLFNSLTQEQTMGVSVSQLYPPGVDPNGRIFGVDECGNATVIDTCPTPIDGIVQPTSAPGVCGPQEGDLVLLGGNQMIVADNAVAKISGHNRPLVGGGFAESVSDPATTVAVRDFVFTSIADGDITVELDATTTNHTWTYDADTGYTLTLGVEGFIDAEKSEDIAELWDKIAALAPGVTPGGTIGFEPRGGVGDGTPGPTNTADIDLNLIRAIDGVVAIDRDSTRFDTTGWGDPGTPPPSEGGTAVPGTIWATNSLVKFTLMKDGVEVDPNDHGAYLLSSDAMYVYDALRTGFLGNVSGGTPAWALESMGSLTFFASDEGTYTVQMELVQYDTDPENSTLVLATNEFSVVVGASSGSTDADYTTTSVDASSFDVNHAASEDAFIDYINGLVQEALGFGPEGVTSLVFGLADEQKNSEDWDPEHANLADAAALAAIVIDPAKANYFSKVEGGEALPAGSKAITGAVPGATALSEGVPAETTAGSFDFTFNGVTFTIGTSLLSSTDDFDLTFAAALGTAGNVWSEGDLEATLATGTFTAANTADKDLFAAALQAALNAAAHTAAGDWPADGPGGTGGTSETGVDPELEAANSFFTVTVKDDPGSDTAWDGGIVVTAEVLEAAFWGTATTGLLGALTTGLTAARDANESGNAIENVTTPAVDPEDASGKTILTFDNTSALNGMTFTFTREENHEGFNAQTGQLTIFIGPEFEKFQGAILSAEEGTDAYDAAVAAADHALRAAVNGAIHANWESIRAFTGNGGGGTNSSVLELEGPPKLAAVQDEAFTIANAIQDAANADNPFGNTADGKTMISGSYVEGPVTGQRGVGQDDAVMSITAKEAGTHMAGINIHFVNDTSSGLEQWNNAYEAEYVSGQPLPQLQVVLQTNTDGSRELIIKANLGTASGSEINAGLLARALNAATIQDMATGKQVAFNSMFDANALQFAPGENNGDGFAGSVLFNRDISGAQGTTVGGYKISSGEGSATSSGIGMLGQSDANERLVIESQEFGSSQFVQINMVKGYMNTVNAWGENSNYGTGQDMLATINGTRATADGNYISINTPDLSVSMSVANGVGGTGFTITGGGALFQLGPDVVSQQQMRVGIASMLTTNIGGKDGQLYMLKEGGAAALNSNDAGRRLADRIINQAIENVAMQRGRLGALQRGSLEPNIMALQDSLTAMTEANALITNADFAVESSNLTRLQLLIQTGMQTLGIANQLPQYAAQLVR